MKICPITYEEFSGPGRYSIRGLKLLSRKLTVLSDLPYTVEEQRREAVARAPKMSIQGVQLKLSARLDGTAQSFRVVDTGGRYILKPQSPIYPELPENEDLSMRLAAAAGIEVPLHGLVYAKDGSRAYFIRRFDREGRGRKLHVEDFAQLSGKSRDTKYNSSMEQVAEIISRYCTFPQIDHKNLFRLTLVNFLIGNEDMHLKNFSVIESNGIVGLSPAYDLVNTSLAMQTQTEEVALPLRGKKKNISKSLLFDYYARERLDLRGEVVDDVVDQLRLSKSVWEDLIDRSFLSESMRASYKELLHSRQRILGI